MGPWLDPECPGSQGKDRKKILLWLFTPRKEQCRGFIWQTEEPVAFCGPAFPQSQEDGPHPAGVPWRGLYSHLSDLATEHRTTVRS